MMIGRGSSTLVALLFVLCVVVGTKAGFVPSCQTCCQINPHLARSAYAGLLNGAFDGSGQATCIANKGYWGTLNAEQESVCEFWFNQGKPDLSKIPGTCDDGALPTCTDKKMPKCSDGKDAAMGVCKDGKPPLCGDKKPPICADGSPLVDPLKSTPAVFNDQSCSSACKQNTGLCVSATGATNLYKALLTASMTPQSPSATPAAGSGAPSKPAAAGAEAAAAAPAAAFR
eukprot:g2619.t1